MPRLPRIDPPRRPNDNAGQLARYLFTSASGHIAERLALQAQGHSDMGGWSQEALEQAIRQFFPDAEALELAALRLVHQEARELIGEADAGGTIPQANLDALRALLWRASGKRRKDG